MKILLVITLVLSGIALARGRKYCHLVPLFYKFGQFMAFSTRFLSVSSGNKQLVSAQYLQADRLGHVLFVFIFQGLTLSAQ